mgnify:CR=1 FL=1
MPIKSMAEKDTSFYAQTGYLPERFPVSVWYLFGGCLFVPLTNCGLG